MTTGAIAVMSIITLVMGFACLIVISDTIRSYKSASRKHSHPSAK